MKQEQTFKNENENLYNSFIEESEFVCANCLSEAEVDDAQDYIYCNFCEAFTFVMKKE